MWRDILIRFGAKPVILTLALVIVISGTLSGSLAWLTAQTKPIKNVFTIGDIMINLDETTGEEYEMEVGGDLAKDPKVTVYADSKKCWVYVKIDLSDNFHDFLSYEYRDDLWEVIEESSDKNTIVYGLKNPVEEANVDQLFYILKGKEGTGSDGVSLENGYVHVKESVTNEMIDEITQSGNYPTMTLTAYAIQWGANPPINDNTTAWPEIKPVESAAMSNAESSIETSATDTSAAIASVNETAALLEQVSQSASKENPFLPETSTSEVVDRTSLNYADRMALQAEEAWIAFATGGTRS